ncbi:MAG: hypothetical protein HN978_19750 [Desulfobacula sp.]|jgi:hypothetical protein|nr:hypothetical protein [Desulfobacula sp.]MBT7051886.1 hypothetical protein [Desulfobacula sp.]
MPANKNINRIESIIADLFKGLGKTINAPWIYTLFKRSEMPEEVNILHSIIFFALASAIINAYSSGMVLYRKVTSNNP